MSARIWHWIAIPSLALLCLAPDCDEAAGGGGGGGDASTSAGEERTRLATTDCEKRGKCIVANGGAFSQTECENANKIEAERALSRSCDDSYDAFLACAAAIEYDCSQRADVQLTTACADRHTSFLNCMSR